MLFNIKNEPIKCLSMIFSLDPDLFEKYKKSGESLILVEDNKLIAEILPWKVVSNHKPTINAIKKFSENNYFTWLPFGIMASVFKLAKLYDDSGRFNKWKNGQAEIPVVKV